MKGYRCLRTNRYTDSQGYQLVPIRPEDIESIRQWRNAQIDVLRQHAVITPQEQQAYFESNIWPSLQQEKPRQVLFSFLLQEDCIGYGGLTHIDWDASRAELSFIVDPLRAHDQALYHSDFIHFFAFLHEVSFKDLRLHRLVAETYAFRQETINLLESVGFKREGILRDHVFKRNQWADSLVLGLLSGEGPKKRDHLQSLLITSISKKVPLIEGVRNAAKKWGRIDLIHGSDSSSECVGRYCVDTFWHCQTLQQTTIHEVIRYCHEHNITFIIPTRDADLDFYAQHRSLLHDKGIYPLVSSPEAVETCLDKKKFADQLIAHHFPAIPTFDTVKEVLGERLVVKEKKGAGSHSVGLDLSAKEALEYSAALKEPIFQPFIEGKEWSVDLYRSFSGKVMGCVARERNNIINGESQITTTKHYPALEELCKRIAIFLNLNGHAVLQVIEKKEGDFHVIECNPRFGGASTASLAVGLDSFFWFLVESSGSHLNDYPFVRMESDIRQVRVATDRILPWSSSLT